MGEAADWGRCDDRKVAGGEAYTGKRKTDNMKNLLVSFSGGETSAFMAQWLKNHYREFGYENIVFVFANTGLENEQTLEFVEKCDAKFDLKLHWVEALVFKGERKGTGYTITDFEHAKRKGEPMEAIIEKYGIPNKATPHCTRELKQAPIKKFAKQWFNGEKYHTAIGIRSDEIDRQNDKAKEMGFIYPLIDKKMIPTTKPMINLYWRSMPFRLELKGYQGNCATCWKKSDKKLYQIAQENPKAFQFMAEMERKYAFDKNGNKQVFFRKKRSALQILKEAKNWKGVVKDDSQIYDWQTSMEFDLESQNESCEVFSECGDT
jgi:hypothetical protein